MVVDDELSMREVLEMMLNKEGYQVTCAENGRNAIGLLEKNQYDLMLCDIRLGDISGLDVLQASKKCNPDTVVILISAYASTETAVEAMNAGAYDYVPKPFDKDELMQTVAKALDLKTLEQEKELLDDQLKENLHFGLLIGNSPAMSHIYKLILQVAKTKTNVLITGESGTGKELIAKSIHQESGRNDQPFGGVQLLMIGDLHQLSPVAKQEDWQILKPYYESVYFFSSHALDQAQLVTIELKHIYRQSDARFIQLLNQVRDNRLDEASIGELNQRYIKNFVPEKDQGYITLTTHNNSADTINKEAQQTF